MLRGFRSVPTGLVVIAGLISVVAGTPVKAGGSLYRGIAPPHSRPAGRSYGEWSAAWWQWALSMPVSANPLFDTAGISAGQRGRVWFLGGALSSNPDPINPNVSVSTANRTGTVPANTSLFFPILNVEASVLEGNGTTPQELRDSARYLMDHAVEMEASIDGRRVAHLDAFRAASPPFVFGPLPANNVMEAAFGVPAPAGTTSLAVADGAYLFVRPLAPGRHTIHWGGTFLFTQENDGFDYTLLLDVKYTINVQRPR